MTKKETCTPIPGPNWLLVEWMDGGCGQRRRTHSGILRVHHVSLLSCCFSQFQVIHSVLNPISKKSSVGIIMAGGGWLTLSVCLLARALSTLLSGTVTCSYRRRTSEIGSSLMLLFRNGGQTYDKSRGNKEEGIRLIIKL